MKNANKITPGTLLVVVLCIAACILSLPAPIRIVITSVYQVPQCTAQFARKFGIRSDYAEVKEYVMESMRVGMTSDEVMKTLGQFGAVSVGNYIPTLDGNGVIRQTVVEICKNPWGNISLDLAFTRDGVLLSIQDTHPQ